MDSGMHPLPMNSNNIFKENKLKMDTGAANINDKIMLPTADKTLGDVSTAEIMLQSMINPGKILPNIPNSEKPLPNFISAEKLPVPLNLPLKLTSEFGDEESNNGPLDFSLHRVQDLVFNGHTDISMPKKSSTPRVKLTLRETSEQRERRLQKGRDRMRNLRANETTEERSVRLLKARKCQERRRQKERVLESPEEREKRLAKARERTRLRREQETVEQREKRLRTTRDRLRFKRMTESPEERQRRLFLQRERKKEKYHRMTPEEKELLRFSERHSKMYKNDPKPERRQTRGICIKYDTFEDDLDEALLKFQSETPDIGTDAEETLGISSNELQQADSEDGSWLAEPEVCLSVGSMENFSPEKNTKEKEENGNQPNVETSESNIPPPQDLQEQLSQHISNVVMNISDNTKPPTNANTSNYKMDSCYSPVPTTQTTQSRTNFNSYQCNNNQAEYMKANGNAGCAINSAPNYSIFHNGRGDNRYQYCTQSYSSQPLNNQSPVSAPLRNEGYSQGSHPIFTQSPAHSLQPNYQDREAPLNLQHHPQMVPRFGHR